MNVLRCCQVKMSKALITGISGQDGSYLAELLVKKGYDVFGLVPGSIEENLKNIDEVKDKIKLLRSDLEDLENIKKILKDVKPDEVYNFASQSQPGKSFKDPINTAKVTAMGALFVLDACYQVNPAAKFFQASSSEMYGLPVEKTQNEKTTFNPLNPYAVSKLFAHNMVQTYRNSFNFFGCNGILFSHESPRRGLNFVTQKVAYAAACIKKGIKNSAKLNEEGEPIVKNLKVSLGNLDAQKDWGYAKDYVEGIFLMLQQEKPGDYVLATGETHSIKELCQIAFGYLNLNWEDFVVIDPRFKRPVETGSLIGDYKKAKEKLNWKPKTKFKELVEMMVEENVKKLSDSSSF